MKKRTAKKIKPRRKKPVVYLTPRRKMEFPEVKGKTIAAFNLYLEHDDTSLAVAFSDRTHLHLDLEPRLTARADLSDWKTGNWRPIKSWPQQQSGSRCTDEDT